jgi:hypothetical protein
LKRLILNLILSLFSLLAVLAAVEIALRLTLYNFKPYAKSPGAESLYVIETAEFKTAIKTNSLNLRDYEIPQKSPGEYRVLCLGDSFTFGLGVNIPDAYPKVAERILTAAVRPVRVINGGTQGNVDDARRFLLEKGLSFEPDLVTLQVYIGNDFYDWQMKSETKAAAPGVLPPRPARRDFLPRAKEFLRGLHWRTFEFVWNRLIQFPLVDDWLYRWNLRYDNRGIFLREYPPLEEGLLRSELQGLDKMHKLCKEKGIELLVILVPTKQQLFKKQFLNDRKYDYKKPNALLRNFCNQKAMPVLDMLEIYETLPPENLRSFYYNQDRHWTVGGHAFMGSVLAEEVKRRL